LRALGYNVHWIGQNGQPIRSTEDPDVLKHALKTNQTIVTSNFDMVIICAEAGEAVIWIDQRSNNLSKERLAVLSFTSIADWQERLQSAGAPVCVRALRTKNETLSLERAHRLALRSTQAKGGQDKEAKGSSARTAR
jgi:predicted nuclease of predicted toxin-antitoxin system